MNRSQNAMFRYAGVVGNMPIFDKLRKHNPVLKYLKVDKPSVSPAFAPKTVKERLELAEKDSKMDSKSENICPDMLASFVAARPKYPDVMTQKRITLLTAGNVVAGAKFHQCSNGLHITILRPAPGCMGMPLPRCYRGRRQQQEKLHDSEDPVALDEAFQVL